MAKVAFPARCAVAVVCGEHLVSQVYPASVPVEVFIDNIVELLNDELKRRGLAGWNPESDTNCTRPMVCDSMSPRLSTNSASKTVPRWCWCPRRRGLLRAAIRVVVHRPGPGGQEAFRTRYRRHRGAHLAGDPGDGLGAVLGLAVRQRIAGDRWCPALSPVVPACWPLGGAPRWPAGGRIALTSRRVWLAGGTAARGEPGRGRPGTSGPRTCSSPPWRPRC